MYAGSWTFNVAGAYESTYHYAPSGTFATPAYVDRVCYWLLGWSYGPPSAYEYDVFVREGPWRTRDHVYRWAPDGPHTFFRGGPPGPVLVGVSWYYPVASGTLVVYYEVPGSPTATPSLSPTPSPTASPSLSPTPSPTASLSPSPSPAPAVDCTRWVDVDDDAPAVFRPIRAGTYWLEVASGSLWWSGRYHGPGVYPYVFDGWGVVRVSGSGRVRFCESDPLAAVTVTATRTPTRTPTITRTPTPTETPGTRTPTVTRTSSLTRTPTPTLAPSPTWTALPTSTRDPYQPPSAVPRYTLAPLTPPPAAGDDVSWDGSLIGDLFDGLEALRRAVAPPAGRICNLPAPVLADAPEYGFRDAFPDFILGLCGFLGVASPVLGFVRLPVTLMVVGFAFWTAWKVFRSLS